MKMTLKTMMMTDLAPPLLRQLPPGNFWRQAYPPVPAGAPLTAPADVPARIPDAAPVCGPAAATVWHPQLPVLPLKLLWLPEQQEEQPEEGLVAVSQRLEESAPSISGLTSFLKRIREECDAAQVCSKRPRQDYEDNPDVQQLMDWQPQVPVQPPKLLWLPEQQMDQPDGGLLSVSQRLEDCAPSTSGLSSFTNMSRDEDNRGSAPSTSGLQVFTGLKICKIFPFGRDGDAPGNLHIWQGRYRPRKRLAPVPTCIWWLDHLFETLRAGLCIWLGKATGSLCI
ncbi:uncharacterized protein [Trachinotus anak]|uniref:uncharacterized protein isoform X1 n=1 Tax=Trachinotus anak TaxID=443729 RepID=UPI0039F23FDE